MGRQRSRSRAMDKIIGEGRKPRAQPLLSGRLARADVHVEPEVFQPRTFSKGRLERDSHVQHLMKAIRAAQRNLLDPILVWWSGKRWLVVDGHHRLEAYEALGRAPRPLEVPEVAAEAFSGSLWGAIAEAARRNSRANLQMTGEDRSEAAWRMVAMQGDPPFTNREIAEAAGIHPRSATTMKQALREFWGDPGDGQEGARDWDQPTRGDVPADPRDITWREVRGLRSPGGTWSEDQVEKQARQWADVLGKQFGKKFAANPTIAAKALEMYSERLMYALAEEWAGLGGREEDDDGEEAA